MPLKRNTSTTATTTTDVSGTQHLFCFFFRYHRRDMRTTVSIDTFICICMYAGVWALLSANNMRNYSNAAFLRRIPLPRPLPLPSLNEWFDIDCSRVFLWLLRLFDLERTLYCNCKLFLQGTIVLICIPVCVNHDDDLNFLTYFLGFL